MISRGGKVEKSTKGVLQQCKFNSPRRVYRHVNMNGMNRIKAHVYGNNAKHQLRCRKIRDSNGLPVDAQQSTKLRSEQTHRT